MSEVLREFGIMNELAMTLNGLEKGEQRRIIAWLEDYFDIYESEEAESASPASYHVSQTSSADDAIDGDFEEFGDEEAVADDDDPQTFESLYDHVSPKTAIQKIVVAAYWLETVEEQDSWKSFEVNKLLKSLDVKVSSVSGTLALEAKKETPLVELLAKSGDSMQARKTFRLSDAGITFVEDRID